jgi:hypothetical protein
MMRFECANQEPFPHPEDEAATDRLRDLLRTNPGFLPNDISQQVDPEARVRDILRPESSWRSLMSLRPFAEELSQNIQGVDREAATAHCSAFVRDDDIVRALLDMAKDFPSGADIDDRWA